MFREPGNSASQFHHIFWADTSSVYYLLQQFDDYYYDDGDDGDDNGDGDGDAGGGGGAADDDDNDGDDEEEDDDNFDDLDKTSVRRRWVASRPETWRFIPNKEPTKYSIPFGKLT